MKRSCPTNRNPVITISDDCTKGLSNSRSFCSHLFLIQGKEIQAAPPAPYFLTYLSNLFWLTFLSFSINLSMKSTCKNVHKKERDSKSDESIHSCEVIAVIVEKEGLQRTLSR